jgi:hypothetical protein
VILENVDTRGKTGIIDAFQKYMNTNRIVLLNG